MMSWIDAARLIGTTIPVSSGKTTRHLPNRSGDRQAINLGQHPSDVVYRRDQAFLLKRAGAELSIREMPAQNDQVEGSALEHPDEFASACALLSFRHRSSDVSYRIADAYGSEATEAIDQQLGDTERVWCVEPWEDVASAADILGIGPTYLLPEQLGVGQREVDRIDDGDAFARQRPWQSPGGGSM